MLLDRQIEIPVNKRKALLLLGLALCFIAFGLFTIFFADEISIKVYIAGLVCIPFFGLGTIILYRRYKSNKPGLISTVLKSQTTAEETPLDQYYGRKLKPFISKKYKSKN